MLRSFRQICAVWKRVEIEASGYLDLRELGRVVLHGAHYLVTDFLFIVIPQQIFTLKHRTKKTLCYQNTGMFDVAAMAERRLVIFSCCDFFTTGLKNK